MDDVTGQPTIVSFSVPTDPLGASEATLRYDGLRLAWVPRAGVNRLADSWQVYGVYLLLGPTDPATTQDGVRFRVYIGQAQSLKQRVRDHAQDRSKDWATHALLIARPADPNFAFNLAEIGWLEGRLHAMLDRAAHAHVQNVAPTGSSGLAESARSALEALVRPITATLRTLGFSTATPDQLVNLEAARSRRTHTNHGVTISDLLEEGVLQPGDELLSAVATFEATATVCADGQIEMNGRKYASPSAPAAEVAGGARNGGTSGVSRPVTEPWYASPSSVPASATPAPPATRPEATDRSAVAPSTEHPVWAV